MADNWRHRLVVVDSCVILDLLTGSDPALQESARWTLGQHGKRYKIVLPAIVIPEIAGSGVINGDQGGQDARRTRVEQAKEWIRQSRYLVADLTERIARQAATLANDYKLKGADASVLATAIAWECTDLYTRDKSLLKLDGEIPGLKISPSSQPLSEQEVLALVLGQRLDE